MAMGTRREHQEELWIASCTLARPASHPFYERLNELLSKHDFDRFVEEKCRRFYAATMGRPGLAPGIYFRLLLLGYFEGIDSERGIAWRAGDSLSIREFVGIPLNEGTPDHTTISRTRRLIDVETHRQVFHWILELLADAGLVKGKRMGIDATTLEANAALRSIVRRDNGESYEEFLKELAQESGIATPTREDLARADRKRKKKGSNEEWVNPHDPDARITKMKDGSTHLAHKAEHAVDMDSGAVVAVTLQEANLGDTTTVKETLAEAGTTVAELIERTFAHCYETGGMRRTHLRKHNNILKRLLIQVAGMNLGLLLRSRYGIGTPRGLQGLSRTLHFLTALLAQAVNCDREQYMESGVTTESFVTPNYHPCLCANSDTLEFAKLISTTDC